MSHPHFSDFDFSSIRDKNAHDFSVFAPGINIAEVVGKRPSQQDTIFVAKVKNAEACRNPKAFYETTIAGIVDRHKACVNGTTLCSAMVTPPSEEEAKAGKTFPKITVANLGDSRAAIIAKMRNGRYVSIILTEDHDLNVLRVSDHVLRRGGEIAPLPEDPARTPRVVYHSASGETHPTLNMGAAIGDCGALGTSGNHVLMTTPDIFDYDLNAFPLLVASPDGSISEVLPKDEILELDLIISCDGLYDIDGFRKLAADFKAFKMDCGIAFYPDKVAGAEGLSEIKKGFDEEHAAGEVSLAAALLDFSSSEGSSDNISVACLSLVSDGKNKITEPVMVTVCDGHGGEEAGRFSGIISSNSSGGEISASVAAKIYLAAEAEHIAGLEMPRGHFHAFLVAAGVKIPVLDVMEKEGRDETPPFSIGGGGGGYGEDGDSPIFTIPAGVVRRGRSQRFWDEEEAKAAGFVSPPPLPEVPASSTAEAGAEAVVVRETELG